MSNAPEYIEEIHEQPDEWHQHPDAEGMPQEEHGARANPIVLGAILVFMLAFTAALVLIVVVLFDSYTTSVRAEKTEITRQYTEFTNERAAVTGAGGTLNTSGVVNAGEGVVRIPIEIAKDKVVEMYADGS